MIIKYKSQYNRLEYIRASIWYFTSVHDGIREFRRAMKNPQIFRIMDAIVALYLEEKSNG